MTPEMYAGIRDRDRFEFDMARQGVQVVTQRMLDRRHLIQYVEELRAAILATADSCDLDETSIDLVSDWVMTE